MVIQSPETGQITYLAPYLAEETNPDFPPGLGRVSCCTEISKFKKKNQIKKAFVIGGFKYTS